GMQLNIQSFWSAPNKLAVEISANGQLFQKVTCDGEKVSLFVMGNAAPVDDAMREQTPFDSYLVGERWCKEAGASLELTGIEQVDGKDAYVVAYTYPSGSTPTASFDKASGLTVNSEKSMQSPTGEVMQ